MTAYERVFTAVFPPPADVTIPTPAATPVLGSTASGESFGDLNTQPSRPQNSAEEQIRWDRAWHTATSFLSLPSEVITITEAKQSEEALKAKWFKPYTLEVANALSYLVSRDSPGVKLRQSLAKDNLLQWYYEEVGGRHYLNYVRPALIKVGAWAHLFIIFHLIDSRPSKMTPMETVCLRQ